VTTQRHLAITTEDHVVEGLLTGGNVSNASGTDIAQDNNEQITPLQTAADSM
jgi:hypothetical protein